MTITPNDLVHREVGACVSSLVSTLTQSYDVGMPGEPGPLADLIEQAFELAAPVDDWEAAAVQAGWAKTENEQWRATAAFAQTHWHADSAEEVCNHFGIEPYQWDVYEHWIVSDWLADKLEAQGEKVDRDFAGLTIWARTTTGLAIAADAVIERICAEINANV